MKDTFPKLRTFKINNLMSKYFPYLEFLEMNN